MRSAEIKSFLSVLPFSVQQSIVFQRESDRSKSVWDYEINVTCLAILVPYVNRGLCPKCADADGFFRLLK